jgi:hypothetical protein
MAPGESFLHAVRAAIAAGPQGQRPAESAFVFDPFDTVIAAE